MPHKVKKPKAYAPGDELLPYQRRWVEDQSKWKIAVQARQTGKDFQAAYEGMSDIAIAEAKGQRCQWVIAAPSERQSLESLQKWKDWATAFKIATASEEILRPSVEGLLKAATITFPRGSSVTAVPGKPETVRGPSANLLLTEFAFFEKPDETWRALIPVAANEISSKKKVRIITTPNGIHNKTYEIWNQNFDARFNHARSKGIWSCHYVPAWAAVQQGLKMDLNQIKEALNDPEGWAQEFECQFLDSTAVLLPYELMAPCEDQEPIGQKPDRWGDTGLKVVGIDYGRKRNLTVAWTIRVLGPLKITTEVLELKNMPTPEQVDALSSRIASADRVCVDATGPGQGMADYLAKKFGTYNPLQHLWGKVEQCVYTNDFKRTICQAVREAFERKEIRIPGSRAIREDLHSVSRVVTKTGLLTYRAQHTDDGHADRFNALALALRAAGTVLGSMAIESYPRWGEAETTQPSAYAKNKKRHNARLRRAYGWDTSATL